MNPAKKEIRDTRIKAGLTQQAAANSVSRCLRAWEEWESGRTKMPIGSWELFLLKNGIVTDEPTP